MKNKKVDIAKLDDAIANGDVKQVAAFIVQTADINQPIGSTPALGESALYTAASYGNLEICELLVLHGADINVKSAGGATPLFRAARLGHASVCTLLVQAGAEVDSANPSAGIFAPLVMAARYGHADVCAALLKGGADPNLVTIDKNGAPATPLHAIRWSEENAGATATALLDGGADPAFTPPRAPTNYLTPFQGVVCHGPAEAALLYYERGGGSLKQITAAGSTLEEVADKRVLPILRALKTDALVRDALSDPAESNPEPKKLSSGSLSPL